MRGAIEYDCGKSIYINDVFLLYYCGGDNDCYYLTRDNKQFRHQVYDHSMYT